MGVVVVVVAPPVVVLLSVVAAATAGIADMVWGRVEGHAIPCHAMPLICGLCSAAGRWRGVKAGRRSPAKPAFIAARRSISRCSGFSG